MAENNSGSGPQTATTGTISTNDTARPLATPPIDLEAIRARAEAAAPGVKRTLDLAAGLAWNAGRKGRDIGPYVCATVELRRDDLAALAVGLAVDVPALLDEVGRLTGDLAEARSQRNEAQAVASTFAADNERLRAALREVVRTQDAGHAPGDADGCEACVAMYDARAALGEP